MSPGTRACCSYLFREAIASLLIPFPYCHRQRYAGEVCRGKQGQLKVFACVPLLCARLNLSWRWSSAALRVRTLKTKSDALINYHQSDRSLKNTYTQVLSLLMIQKRASYSAWMFISSPPDEFEISTATQELETRERRLNTTGWRGKTIWDEGPLKHLTAVEQ